MSHAEAVRLYESFTEMPATKNFAGEIPQPTELEMLGEIAHVVYVSDKWHEREGRAGKDAWMRYIHDFKHNRPVLCYDPDHDWYHVLGKVLVKDTGINDWRGKDAGRTGSRPSYSIPKALTFLGRLEEIVYEDEEDGQEYKVEFPASKTALCSNGSGLRLFIAKFQ